MKNRLLPFFTLLAMAAILTVSSCKKENASVVGNWKLTAIQGNASTYYIENIGGGITDSANYTTTIEYSSGSGVITRVNTGSNNNSTARLYTLQMNIQNGGTVAVTETDTVSPATPDTYVNTGSWDYLNNTAGSSALVFNNISGSIFASYLGGTSNSYVVQIQSLTSNSMVLSFTSNFSSTTPVNQSSLSETFTFSK